jgi:hypothetical protein
MLTRMLMRSLNRVLIGVTVAGILALAALLR